MFQDEGRFGRICNPRRCWAPEGFRPSVPAQLIREFTYVFAAVSPCDGVMDSLILPEVNTQVMSIFLEEVSSRHHDDFIIMFMDRAGWHRSHNLTVPENMILKWLPPYSPECNPVEHIWEDIRENWFSNTVFNSLDAVENTLVDSLVALETNTQKVFALTGFDWVICNCMNAT
jgi:transposase